MARGPCGFGFEPSFYPPASFSSGADRIRPASLGPVFAQGPSFRINALIGVAFQEGGRCLPRQHIHQEAGRRS